MLAARLHGPRDFRIEELPRPGKPAPGQSLIRVTGVGVCGSDLHTFRHAAIGDTRLEGPLILGHEFAGIVEAVGEDSLDGFFRPLRPGTPVAVDPARNCGRCEWCERGDPNLCVNMRFLGLWPFDGAMCQWIEMPSRNCFPLGASVELAEAPLLEPLGVAIHTIDLAKLRPGKTVAVLGAGPIGLGILQLVRHCGADAVLVTEKLAWRAELAERLGASQTWLATETDVVEAVLKATGGRGVDVAIEAADCGESVRQAAEMLAPGGRLVVVGIPDDDRLVLAHSTLRRKGISIIMVRRMKHAYPRAIRLVEQGAVQLSPLVSHRFPLARAAEAFALAADYRDGVVKVMIEMP
jgi:L-iditol 2-dehydrogenase